MGMMNMILHGVESPKFGPVPTLSHEISATSRNPNATTSFFPTPLSAAKRKKNQIQQNFPIQSNATELLFLPALHAFTQTRRQSGHCRAGRHPLSQTGNAFAQVKKELLENFNLHTISSLPPGVFLPYSAVKTNVLFFNRAGRTRDIWHDECVPEQKLTKNRPLSDDHLADFIARFRTRDTTDASWTDYLVEQLPKSGDLTARNPNRQTGR